MKAQRFAQLTKKRNVENQVVLKSCDRAKHVSTEVQFFKQIQISNYKRIQHRTKNMMCFLYLVFCLA